MNEITELTPQQWAKVPYYKEKWEKIGLEYREIDKPKAEALLRKCLAIANLNPQEYVFLASPKACEDEINRRADNKKWEYYSLDRFYQGGNINAGYCCFYDFLIEEVKKPDPDTMKIWEVFRDVCAELHYFFVFDTVVFCSEKPLYMMFNKENQLHADNKPCAIYKDGFGMYALNGVRMPKHIVETPADKLDPELFQKIENAEIRREFIRKVGIERVVKNAEIMDMKGDYELLKFLVPKAQVKERVYLKMINPSIGTYHVEGVPPTCKTVADALYFRNGTHEQPTILT